MPTISLKTSIPGPKSKALLARRTAAVPQGVFNISPIFLERGEGATITDVDGNVLLDFSGGLGSLNAGHANPKVVEAVTAQAKKFLHTCFHIAQYEPYVALAEKLNAITPSKFAKKTLLVNSGAEAVENAVKIARYYTKRPAVDLTMVPWQDSMKERQPPSPWPFRSAPICCSWTIARA